METISKYIVVVSVLLMTLSGEVYAQKNKKALEKAAYAEFQEVSQWYSKLPFQMELVFNQVSYPQETGEDSVGSVMKMYYATSGYYMIAEGVEQIADDSLLVVVNHDARMITVYTGEQSVLSRLEQPGLMLAGDSVKKALLGRFDMATKNDGKVRGVYFTSRERISESKWPKEELTVFYSPETKVPVLFEQIQRTLMPIDSIEYESLKLKSTYEDRCLKKPTGNGVLYFIIRDHKTSCQYSNFSHDLAGSPVKPADRVVWQPNGRFKPAKGFEEFMISIEH